MTVRKSSSDSDPPDYGPDKPNAPAVFNLTTNRLMKPSQAEWPGSLDRGPVTNLTIESIPSKNEIFAQVDRRYRQMPPTEALSDHNLITPQLVAKTIAGGFRSSGTPKGLYRTPGRRHRRRQPHCRRRAVQAQLISSNGSVWWQVYAVDGTPPAWTVVGAQTDITSSWSGS